MGRGGSKLSRVVPLRREPVAAVAEAIDPALQADVEDVENLVSALESDQIQTVDLQLVGRELPRAQLWLGVYRLDSGGEPQLLGRTVLLTVRAAFDALFSPAIALRPDAHPLLFRLWEERAARATLLGEARCEWPQLEHGAEALTLSLPPSRAALLVRAQPSDIGLVKHFLELELAAFEVTLPLRFHVCAEDKRKQFLLIYASEAQSPSASCRFRPFAINANQLRDEGTRLRFDFFECRDNCPVRELGTYTVSLQGLRNLPEHAITAGSLRIGLMRVHGWRRVESGRFLRAFHAGHTIKSIFVLDLALGGPVRSSAITSADEAFRTLVEQNALPQTNPVAAQLGERWPAIDMTIRVLKCFDDDSRPAVYCTGARPASTFAAAPGCFALNGNFHAPFYPSVVELKVDFRAKLNSRALVPGSQSLLAAAVELVVSLVRAQLAEQSASSYYFLAAVIAGGLPVDRLQLTAVLRAAVDLPLSVLLVFCPHPAERDDAEHTETFKADIDALNAEVVGAGGRAMLLGVTADRHSNSSSVFAGKVFSHLTPQFLEHATRQGWSAPSLEDCRGIKPQLIQRIRAAAHNQSPSADLDRLLSARKERLRVDLEAAGFDRELLAQLLAEGVPAEDPALIYELLGGLQKRRKRERSASLSIGRLKVEENLPAGLLKYGPQVEVRTRKSAQSEEVAVAEEGKAQRGTDFARRYYPRGIAELLAGEAQTSPKEHASVALEPPLVNTRLQPYLLDVESGPPLNGLPATQNHAQEAMSLRGHGARPSPASVETVAIAPSLSSLDDALAPLNSRNGRSDSALASDASSLQAPGAAPIHSQEEISDGGLSWEWGSTWRDRRSDPEDSSSEED